MSTRDASAKEIGKAVGADPALTGRLLKFANSPHVGFSRPIVAIENAVVLLGVHVVRDLSLSLSVLSNTRSGKCENFDYQGFWGRSLATGIAAQVLCSLNHIKFAPEEAFVCGLLARVGCLALASIYSDVYSEIITGLGRRQFGRPKNPRAPKSLHRSYRTFRSIDARLGTPTRISLGGPQF